MSHKAQSQVLPPRYRILTVFPSPAGTSRKEITEHWEWLEHNLLQTLSIFENENDITTFVKGKVQVHFSRISPSSFCLCV